MVDEVDEVRLCQNLKGANVARQVVEDFGHQVAELICIHKCNKSTVSASGMILLLGLMSPWSRMLQLHSSTQFLLHQQQSLVPSSLPHCHYLPREYGCRQRRQGGCRLSYLDANGMILLLEATPIPELMSPGKKELQLLAICSILSCPSPREQEFSLPRKFPGDFLA